MSLETPKEEKFFFNRHFFDVKTTPEEEQEEIIEEIEEPEPPAPTFSEQDLKNARDKAHEAGKIAGKKEAQESTAQTMLQLIKSLQQQFGQLLVQEQERAKIFETEAIRLNTAIIKKISPQLIDRFGNQMIEEIITTALTDYKKEDKLTINIHENQKQQFEKIFTDQGFTNFKTNTTTITDPAQCTIEWTDGGMIIDLSQLSGKIESILHQFLEEKPVNSHDGKQSAENTPNDSDPQSGDES